MNDKNIDFLNTRLEQYKTHIHTLETELANERVANETNAVKVYELGKRVAELETALRNLLLSADVYAEDAPYMMSTAREQARAALGE